MSEVQTVAGTVAPWAPVDGVGLHGLIELAAANPRAARSQAAALADTLLGSVGTRLAHSACVARRVEQIGHMVDRRWQPALYEAAWLHDVGYHGRIAFTGFHPLDGARWLQASGWQPETCRLVAWHTAASTEGTLRGLADALAAEFAPPVPLAAAALTWADLTSSPTGAEWTVHRRVADILRRHPADSVVHRAVVAALPELWAAVEKVEFRLAGPTETV
ncbi:MAG: hypothetical protein ACXVH3_23390 [Solirubrobacteraceae bacterium]